MSILDDPGKSEWEDAGEEQRIKYWYFVFQSNMLLQGKEVHIFKTFGHKNTCLNKCVIFTVSTLKYTL